jgi:hypothetical protein
MLAIAGWAVVGFGPRVLESAQVHFPPPLLFYFSFIISVLFPNQNSN